MSLIDFRSVLNFRAQVSTNQSQTFLSGATSSVWIFSNRILAVSRAEKYQARKDRGLFTTLSFANDVSFVRTHKMFKKKSNVTAVCFVPQVVTNYKL